MEKKTFEGVYWWYEAWDATWKLYDARIRREIEEQNQKHQMKVMISMKRI